MQGDAYSLYGEMVVPALLSAAGDANLSAEEQLVVDALADWGYTCPTGLDGSDPETAGDIADEAVAAEAIGCTAFHLALFGLAEEATRDEASAAGVSYFSGLSNVLVARAIAKPESLLAGEGFWDDLETPELETRDDIALRAISRVALVLSELGVPNDWRWGRLHTLTLRSIYDNFGVADYNVGPFAAPGGVSTVNVSSPSKRTLPASGSAIDLAFAHGPSIRLVTEQTAEGPRMQFNLPGGADLHRESAFYNNLLPGWLDNELVDLKFGPGAVTDPAEVVEVSPAP
jgi:penicillin amidase